MSGEPCRSRHTVVVGFSGDPVFPADSFVMRREGLFGSQIPG